MTAPATSALQLRLLRGFELCVGDQVVALMAVAQRVAAFVALQDRALSRTYVSGMLWPDVPAGRANANLRSAVWRLQRSCSDLIDTSMQYLRLAPGVAVDLHNAMDISHRLLSSHETVPQDLTSSVRTQLSSELLPDWCDEWVLMERERFRQLRLHALEALARRLTSAGRYAEAIDAGLAAVRGEPLRETAHRAVICAHLAEGNQAEAIQQYQRCQRILEDELGIEPSSDLRQLVLVGSRR
jgi:DNA-binding SARP family transcriptional activator